MKIGIIGVGKMGQQIAQRLVSAGHEVVVTDHNESFVAVAVAAGATGVPGRDELVAKLGEQAVIWLMIPANFVDGELAALLELIPSGSVIIDGGNSNYVDTLRRSQVATAKGAQLVDVGTSGGVLGLRNGFSLMVGGDPSTVERLSPIFEALAQSGGWGHFGPTGSGHFIKMVHNGIEYGVMEAYAEGYRLLHDNPDFDSIDLAKVAGVWQHGSIISSGLNALTEQVLTENPQLEGIDGVVAQTGEATWTIEAAAKAKVDVPVIQAAVDVRDASAQGSISFATKLLAGMRHAFGGHPLNK